MSRDRPSLRSQVTVTLLALGVISVIALSTVNYVVVGRLLDRSVDAQITTLRDEQANTIRRGFQNVEARVANVARDPAVVDALAQLSAGYDAVDVELTDDEIVELESYYESTVLDAFRNAGVEHPPAQDLVPTSTAGRYVQWAHLGGGVLADGGGERSPEYDAAHSEHDATLRELAAQGLGDDFLLYASSSREIVYSTQERIDLGTNLAEGPYASTGFGRIPDRLAAAASGAPVVIDGSFFLPAVATPTIFVSAAVRSETEEIGAVIVSIPTSVLTALTTADRDWAALGLGDSGETYVVGSDLTLRSESREWLEDEADYLRRCS